MERKMHRVQRWRASSARDSPGGMGVRPATRVRMTVWVTSGRVRLSTAAAAEARAEEMPGTTPTSIPAASKGRTISIRAP